jgi:putative endopeptidase
MTNLETTFKQFSIEQWKNYAKWQLVLASCKYLSKEFDNAQFAYYEIALRGISQMKPRWERAHENCEASLGHAISELYVKKHFPPQSKAKMDVMIENLIGAFRDRITSRTWMSENTKKEANRKLDLLLKKIGYPAKWDDYSTMAVTKANYWSNITSAANYYHKKSMGELYKPTDRNKWQMVPTMVNAYYDPSVDEIAFPAAILQPPFFDATADDAFNYGIMGAIIGHELTHGFDDGGAQFDADGNLRMWWTDQDYKNFKERTQKIVQQFNNIVMIDTMHVNGEMTQGENIADLGGLTMAYYAYKKSLNGKSSPKIKGFSGEQRFFIAWAQGWKSMSTDKETKRLLVLDYHGPAKLRAYVPLTNMPEFYEAFNIKEGDAMREKESKRVEIW